MIYDITQPLPECRVFPGDDRPELTRVKSMERGDEYNLTNLSLCAHNGTHVDAPRHFLREGKGVDRLPPEKFLGPAYVAAHAGDVTAQDARRILERAKQARPGAEKRILIKGRATVTLAAAEVFAAAGTALLGNESQTVGPEEAPMAVHLALLGAETALLEGVCLEAVPEGAYFLSCAPLKLTDGDGAPCRALLLAPEEAPLA